MSFSLSVTDSFVVLHVVELVILVTSPSFWQVFWMVLGHFGFL